MKSFKRTLALILSISLFSLSFGQAQAAIIANNQIIHQAQQGTDKAALLQMIHRTEVQEQLLDMGVTSADIEERINQMTQEEVAQLNQQLEQLPVVFVVTDVIGATDIFPFIHPVK